MLYKLTAEPPDVMLHCLYVELDNNRRICIVPRFAVRRLRSQPMHTFRVFGVGMISTILCT